MHLKKSALLVSFVLLATGARSAPSSNDYCSCLESASHAATGRYDFGFDISIVVPKASRKTRLEGGEADSFRWSDGKSKIYLSGYLKSSAGAIPWDNPGEGQCVIEVNRRRVFIGGTLHKDKPAVSASFDRGNNIFVLGIAARDRKTVCSLAATTIWSAVFDVNKLEGLKILSISRDRKSFLYRNEVGAVMSAKVGDVITRDDDRVVAISGSVVKLIGLAPDGAGGWNEVPRALNMGNGGGVK